MEKEEKTNIIVLADYRNLRQYSVNHPSVYYKLKRMRDKLNGV
jgi:hypothetical protein|tara:strand:- start:12426 stop:12554 length:129 start_codon:yes stop_codon:yes gene_type:complete